MRHSDPEHHFFRTPCKRLYKKIRFYDDLKIIKNFIFSGNLELNENTLILDTVLDTVFEDLRIVELTIKEPFDSLWTRVPENIALKLSVLRANSAV